MATKNYECPSCGEEFENDFDEIQIVKCLECDAVIELDTAGQVVEVEGEDDDDYSEDADSD